MKIMRLIKRLLNASYDDRDELPPPLTDSPIPPAQDRHRLLEETRFEMQHRERVLTELETRARVIGGWPRSDDDE